MNDKTPAERAGPLAIIDLHKQRQAWYDSQMPSRETVPPTKTFKAIFEEHDKQRESRQSPSYDRNSHTILQTDAYPPSHARLADLKPIEIANLQIGKHHRGRVLFLRTADEPLESSALEIAVEDTRGAAERLAVYHLDHRALRRDHFPDGTVLAIKEPYYTLTIYNATLLRVDHPTDLVIMEASEAMVPPSFKTTSIQCDAKSLNDEARVAFRKQDYEAARKLYTRALEQCNDADAIHRAPILRNRALTNLCLGLRQQTSDDLDAAIQSAKEVAKEAVKNPAKEAATHDAQGGAQDGAQERVQQGAQEDLSSKVRQMREWLLLGKVSHSIGDYDTATTAYQSVLDQCLDVDHAMEAQEALANATLRLAEQASGDYDFAAIIPDVVARSNHHSRCASFLDNTEIPKSSIAGQGLFAKKALKMGDIVLCEPAFAIATQDDAHYISLDAADGEDTDNVADSYHPYLVARITARLRRDPEMAAEFYNLHSSTADPPKTTLVDGELLIDTSKVASIVAYNFFGYLTPALNSNDKEVRRSDLR